MESDRKFRAELAAAFRWAARLNFHEATANHFSVAVSESGQEFLINPRGRSFSQMRASDLVLVNADHRNADSLNGDV
ncbi:MAG: class II aldolase/adducin family protein, partial [Ilumatobacteraceae bacterium]